ncbi:MAG: ABC transporter ATP-binding protein [Kineosporiaceae bacterium]
MTTTASGSGAHGASAARTAAHLGGGRDVDGPAVTVRGLVKRYGDKLAVDHLDLTIAHGEVFALLGPNGAGKTTTVEILEGYRRRDAGEVDVLGGDPATGGAAWRSQLGVVLQSSTENAELTVEEFVRHFARYYPAPRDPDEVIEVVGLAEKRRARTRSLSGGQRRRLDVALGIIGNPRLLFLDEPTTGFDPEARRAFWQLVRTLRGEGTTILLTTHYLDEVEQLADRVAVIADGRLRALDVPAHLGGRHAHQARVRWTEDGAPREVTSATPTSVVAELSARLGGEVPDLQVVRPSLEDVYLDLIGSGGTTVDLTTEAAR